MSDILAYSPASLSFVFKSCPNMNLLKMGSVGIGCTIDKGVIVRARTSSYTEILFNNSSIQFPTVHDVIRQLAKKPVRVEIESQLPLGFGFGISAASALSCALVLNKLFSLGKEKKELVEIAHVAEIKNRTGLGSVGTQATGGFLFKTFPGLPVKAQKYPFIGKKLYVIIIEKLETPTVLKNSRKLKKINETANFTFEKLKKNKSISLDDIIDLSYEFAMESGLLENERVVSLIQKIRKEGGHATMLILGQVVVSTTKPLFRTDYQIERLVITSDQMHLL